MNIVDYTDLIEAFTKSRHKTLELRGSQYADNQEDTLSSFRRVGAILTILDIDKLDWQQKHHINMIVMKLDRLINQIKDAKADPMKVEDTFADLLNYEEMYYASMVENRVR